MACRDGLFIKDIKADEQIEAVAGYKLSSLAPWLYLKDTWLIRGDFSLPVLKNRKSYGTWRGDLVLAKKDGAIHR